MSGAHPPLVYLYIPQPYLPFSSSQNSFTGERIGSSEENKNLSRVSSHMMNHHAQSKTEQVLDASLHSFGFQIDHVSAQKVSGHLLITPKCCQPFNMLSGGVSALIAESLASMGAHLASGLRRVAGISLSINHVKSAQLGEFIVAEATPVNVGRTIQVWDVRISKCDPTNYYDDYGTARTLISSSTVTLVCNLPVPESAKEAGEALKRAAKLNEEGSSKKMIVSAIKTTHAATISMKSCTQAGRFGS